MLDWPNKLLDGVPNAGAASELAAVLDCPNKPLDCRPSDAAVVLATVFAGADVAAVFADADLAAVFAGADVAAGARLDDGRACEVDRGAAEDWKRPAVADADGKPPGCGGFCRHHRQKAERRKKCTPFGRCTASLQVSLTVSSSVLKAASSWLCKLCSSSWSDSQVSLFRMPVAISGGNATVYVFQLSCWGAEPPESAAQS